MFTSGSVVEDLRSQHAAVAALCASLDPRAVHDAEVPEAFRLLAGMQKLVAGAVTRMAARYEEAGDWKRRGARSAPDDIARQTGTSPGRAKRSLDTSRRLAALPGTDGALRNGALSPDQADAVASGASASPGEEDDLLALAEKESLHSLRRKAAEVRAAADHDREARRARQHGLRRVNRWIDDDGLYNLLLKVAPEHGPEIDAALKPGIDRAYADARDAGRFEPYEAYAADVVVSRLTGTGGDTAAASRRTQAVRPDRKVIARIDVSALNRGHVEGEETCEIAGVGPVSVASVRALLSDAFLALVITDGVDVRNVTHLGRQVTAHQRTALEQRGYRCEVCGSTHHLDLDHVTGWKLTHTTTLDDLAWLCGHDHGRKTREGLVLVGPPGKRTLVRPPPARPDGPAPPPVVDQQDLFTTAR